MTTGFNRTPSSRMRQRRNNSVVPSAGPVDEADTSQLSIVDDGSDDSGSPSDDDGAAAGESNRADTAAEPGSADHESGSAEGAAEEPQGRAETGADPNGNFDDGTVSAAPDPEPAPVPETKGTRNKRGSKSSAKSPAKTSGKEDESPTTLAVINPDGSISVDPRVHLLDLRTIANETDPHVLVDMLGALRQVTDSELRASAATTLTNAIGAAALA